VSMQPQPWPEPVSAVARAIRAMYRGKRQVPLPVRVRDELGELFADAEFAVAFGAEGKPGWSPGRLALVSVLQRVENLTAVCVKSNETGAVWSLGCRRLGVGLGGAGLLGRI
jgi:hypothetical protein